MKIRRNDYDITDSVQTTDPGAVADAVEKLYCNLYRTSSSGMIHRLFANVDAFYSGRHPDYHACDASYHDIQHVMDVSLTAARLMDGYARSADGTTLPLDKDLFIVGAVVALFHDFGYLRRRGDRKHKHGAEYTRTHVSRGARFLRKYFEALGMPQYATLASRLIHFTGYERPVATIPLKNPLHRRLGQIIGTADILAQMSDRCYLEKCRDRLFPEFVLGGLTHRMLPDGQTETLFASGEDLVRKSPVFFKGALKRLEVDLGRAHVYANQHFGGRNPYLAEIEKSIAYAGNIATGSGSSELRRTAPQAAAGAPA